MGLVEKRGSWGEDRFGVLEGLEPRGVLEVGREEGVVKITDFAGERME